MFHNRIMCVFSLERRALYITFLVYLVGVFWRQMVFRFNNILHNASVIYERIKIVECTYDVNTLIAISQHRKFKPLLNTYNEERTVHVVGFMFVFLSLPTRTLTTFTTLSANFKPFVLYVMFSLSHLHCHFYALFDTVVRFI